jgi:CRP/FNR family transcriptional regulator
MTLLDHAVSAATSNALLGQFPEQGWGFETLFDKQPTETFSSGETLFFEGDPARHVFEITEGVVRLCKMLMDGRRVICGFLFEGDVVGMSQRHRFMYSAEAVNGLKVRRITRRSLDEAMERTPKLRPQIFSRMCDEMEAVQRQMVLLSCKNAEERVCSFIVELMDRQALPGERPILIDLPMTRLDMADYLGMTIETVSRNLTRLAKKGVLTNVERSTLRIAKPRLLKELAGIWAEEDDAEDWEDTDRAISRVPRH